MVTVWALVVPGGEFGSETITDAVPVALISPAGTCATSSVEETKVVASPVPFHSTVDVPVKAVPSAVSMKDGPPTVTVVGEMEFSASGVGLVVKLSKLEVP